MGIHDACPCHEEPYRICGCDEEKVNPCTCTYGAYLKHAAGTGFDLVSYDPECPEHFPVEEHPNYIPDPDPEFYGGPDYDLARDMDRGK